MSPFNECLMSFESRNKWLFILAIRRRIWDRINDIRKWTVAISGTRITPSGKQQNLAVPGRTCLLMIKTNIECRQKEQVARVEPLALSKWKKLLLISFCCKIKNGKNMITQIHLTVMFQITTCICNFLKASWCYFREV